LGLGIDYTLKVVALGAGLLGATGGVLGTFAVLRRQSLLGDAVSHAALPGVALAFLLTGSKASIVLMLGAAATGWLATLGVRSVVRRSRVPYDSALGLGLSVFFGLGLVLLTHIQNRPDAAQAGLDTFLFGQAAVLLQEDLVVMGVLAAAAVACVAVLWKELKLLSFDPDFGASLGLPVGLLDVALTGLVVVAIVIGLQTVGVVLMSALIVAPAAAARQWTRRLGPMVLVAAVFGMVGGLGGAIASSFLDLPTGPPIVLALGMIVVVSIAAVPQRGLLWRRVRLGSARRVDEARPVLLHLYALSLQHQDPEHGHSQAVLRAMSPRGADVEAALRALELRGLAFETRGGLWAPTATGRGAARQVLEAEEVEA